jgi:hypothetical protein
MIVRLQPSVAITYKRPPVAAGVRQNRTPFLRPDQRRDT